MPALAVRDARQGELWRIVEIYNASIPGRTATADLDPVTVDDRWDWFHAHRADRRPLWVVHHDAGGYEEIVAWLSYSDFYGRPAYAATAEVSVYVDPAWHGKGIGRWLVSGAIEHAPALGLSTLLAFVFDHNAASLGLFESEGFERWGHLPDVAALDGVERGLVLLGRKV